MDSDRADSTVKPNFGDRSLNESNMLPSPNRQPLPWQLKQGAPAAGPSYSRLREQHISLDLVAALKGIGKRSAGDGGDGRDKEGK
jgi:transcription initiation factor TFIIB